MTRTYIISFTVNILRKINVPNVPTYKHPVHILRDGGHLPHPVLSRVRMGIPEVLALESCTPKTIDLNYNLWGVSPIFALLISNIAKFIRHSASVPQPPFAGRMRPAIFFKENNYFTEYFVRSEFHVVVVTF